MKVKMQGFSGMMISRTFSEIDLDYDDIAVIGEDYTKIQSTLNNMNPMAEIIVIKINISKIKILSAKISIGINSVSYKIVFHLVLKLNC